MSLRIIPVIDLRNGRAVHARGGRRDEYGPLRSRLCDDDPVALARAYRDDLGCGEVYVADLDAIEGRPPDLGVLRALAALGLGLWVDAGVRGAEQFRALRGAGVDSIVLATETLPGPETLRRLGRYFGPLRIVFGLDLRAGVPLLDAAAGWWSSEPFDLLVEAWDCGARRFLVLDLAHVGSGAGFGGLTAAADFRASRRGAEVAVGGGVAGPADLEHARRAGIDAVLVASALHDGRLTRADLDHGPA